MDVVDLVICLFGEVMTVEDCLRRMADELERRFKDSPEGFYVWTQHRAATAAVKRLGERLADSIKCLNEEGY